MNYYNFYVLAFLFILFIGCNSNLDNKIKITETDNTVDGSVEFSYLEASVGDLSFKSFVENDSLFIQDIKKGDSAEKIFLSFDSIEEIHSYTFYRYNEVINGKMTGGKYLLHDDYGAYSLVPDIMNNIYYRDNNGDEKYYYVYVCLGAADSLKIETKTLPEAESIIRQIIQETAYEDLSQSYYIDNWNRLLYLNPNTLDYDFKLLQDSCMIRIAKSKDANFACYSQSYWIGGHGRLSFSDNSIFQYRTKDGVKTINSHSIGAFPDEGHLPLIQNLRVNTFHINDTPIYLLSTIFDDISYTSESIEIYTIENGILKKLSLFNTGKEILSSIYFQYNDGQNDNYSFNIKVNSNSSIFYIPVVKNGIITSKYLKYQWDGEYFTYKSIE